MGEAIFKINILYILETLAMSCHSFCDADGTVSAPKLQKFRGHPLPNKVVLRTSRGDDL